MKRTQKLPEGWTEARIHSVIDHYENQTPAEARTEDEASVAARDTLMEVPKELVPKVRQLIAKHQGR